MTPTSLAWVALVALLVAGGAGVRRAAGRWVAILATAVLVLLGFPFVSLPMLAALDVPGVDVAVGGGPGEAAAIVILSADVQRTGTPGLAAVGPLTLERERAGAALARRTGLPILVTGGIVAMPPPVGGLMATSMAADFGVPVRWAEVRSGTTWENAEFSVPILRRAGIKRVFLVTHAWHMRRALLAFRRAGMPAEAAATELTDPWLSHTMGDFAMRPSSWERSYLAIHEWVGLVWYRVRAGSPGMPG